MKPRQNGLPERPPSFVYKPGLGKSGQTVLHCEGVPLSSLANRFGTPLYVYSATTIRQRMRTFAAAFRGFPHTVCYSLKANSNLSVLRVLAATGCGFDVVSGGELQRVLRLGKKYAKKVVFSGVGKTREELLLALKSGALLFNVEGASELGVLADCAARSKRTARVAIRVNPDVSADTHPYIATGLQQHKFGVPLEEARSLYAHAAKEKYLQVAGVSVHIGSQIVDVAPFTAAMERVAGLVRQLRSDGHRIEHVDAGGGLGIPYQDVEASGFEQSVAQYAAALARPLRGLDVHLLLEPGRSIVGPAGALLTRVVYRKTNGSKQFLIVDAAMNDLMRPSLYNAHHEIALVAPRNNAPQEVVDVVGPICESGDFFARARTLPKVEEGDLLAILDAGAYGFVLASNYNARPRPAEVLVNAKTAKLARRRETMADLLRGE